MANPVNISLDMQTTSWGLVFFSVCFCWGPNYLLRTWKPLDGCLGFFICINFSEGVVRCVFTWMWTLELMSWVVGFWMIVDVSNRMGWNANLMGWNPHTSVLTFLSRKPTWPGLPVSIWQCLGRCAISPSCEPFNNYYWEVLSINPQQDYPR